jgi:hypothetical protein
LPATVDLDQLLPPDLVEGDAGSERADGQVALALGRA